MVRVHILVGGMFGKIRESITDVPSMIYLEHTTYVDH